MDFIVFFPTAEIGMWIGPISTLEEAYSGTLDLCNLANSIVLRLVGRGTHDGRVLG